MPPTLFAPTRNGSYSDYIPRLPEKSSQRVPSRVDIRERSRRYENTTRQLPTQRLVERYTASKKKARCCGPLVLIWRRSVFAEPKTQQMQKVIEEHENICEQPGGGDDVVSFPALNNALRLPDNPAAGEQDKHD